ncbi:MAG: hypothetical protein HYX79_07675 [Chloroflexi bacterium]|nr:hypothetical protein [Chloroflexota bacterium]
MAKTKGHKCPICGKSDWKIVKRRIPGLTVMQQKMVCKDCGYEELIS